MAHPATQQKSRNEHAQQEQWRVRDNLTNLRTPIAHGKVRRVMLLQSSPQKQLSIPNGKL